ncbi:MAG TPA: SDR family NAD(P)-dependent oxidoreductase, partial [Candidatus Stackebrandtia faecavium]|nr:SDR family NAD(P)-dependent oxidoreductase [Candidatus Stackebrandtia faecavium]
MAQPTPPPLNQRVAVVTGATGTIGSAITNDLHEDGAQVAMLGRRGRRLERLKKRCGDDKRLLPIRADVV